MGALTLKTFPFELRGWEIKKFNSFDITDGFGTKLKLCINNKKIVQIEPANHHTHKPMWLHDKARQFFDSLNTNQVNNLNIWSNTNKILYKVIYLYGICDLKYSFKHYFTVLYENISLNLLALLMLYSQKFSFIKLKKVEKNSLNNNLESNFTITKKLDPNFKKCSLSLIISNNLRLEGSHLNLIIKQRMIKGNFRCFLIGSFINLTYHVNFLGKTSANIIKSLTEGTHLICQNFKASKNSTILINSELLKRKDSKNLKKMFFEFAKLNPKTTFNCLNLTIFETGTFYLKKPEILKNKDILQFNSIFLINLTPHNTNFIKSLLKINLFYSNFYTKPSIKNMYINSNLHKTQNIFKQNFRKKFDKYLYLTPKTIFETKNTFFNTKGIIKQTNEIVLKNKTKSDWKNIRYLFNNFKTNLIHLNKKTNLKLNVYLKNNNLSIFINLNYIALKSIDKNRLHLNNNMNTFLIKNNTLKLKKIKFFNTKIKFWLNDFFTGGKDGLSQNSLIMIRCSNLKRLQSSNFF